KGMPLRRLELGDCTRVKDFSPLQAMPLEYLVLARCSQFTDLACLTGLTKLKELRLDGTNVEDLSPLQGLPLTSLNLFGCHHLNGDLRPLKDMPLKKLSLASSSANRIIDIGPLASLKELTELSLYNTQVKNLTPLQGLPLQNLSIYTSGR